MERGGFGNPDRARELLTRLGDAPAETERLLLRSPDPDMALLNLARFVEVSGAPPADMVAAIHLFAGSQSMSNAVIREPGLLAEVLGDRGLPSRDALLGRARAEVSGAAADPRAPLRRFVRRETLRLLLADLSGLADLPAVTAALSAIASAAADAALGVALAETSAGHGTPRDEAGREATITVIGLGKLGGNELNYSSDIDILFLYSADGWTDAAAPPARVENRDYFARVVERTRRLLADATPDGHCYRVDLRLRPEGGTGVIARTVASALEYYVRSGRPWERQMLIKAGVIAGDRELGERGFLEPVMDFVYGAPLTLDAIRQIKGLKLEIERKGGGNRQVKVGRGGIRDVEFTVQFLQLLNGHRLAAVREAGTLPALKKLHAAGALTEAERTALEESYVFLRTVEHRLQTVHEIRTHMLPAEPKGLSRLALRLGLGQGEANPVDEFHRLHSRHTAAARSILERLFHNVFLERSDAARDISNFVLDPEGAEAAMAAWLAERGFTDVAGAVATLRRMAADENPRARKFLASLLPHLLLHVTDTPDPDRCLRNLERIVRALGAPATFYQLLSEYEDILDVFTDVSGWSQHLSDLLVRNPSMIDAFADSLVMDPGSDRAAWDDLPLEGIEVETHPEEVLSDLKDLSLLRIGVRDIQRKANTLNTAEALTALAERILALAERNRRAALFHRLGRPKPGARFSFAILGLGKLGTGEMSYASDLDVVFVADAEGETETGADLREVAVRLAQNIIRLLAVPGARGRLYEVDPRVRPYGRSGPVVSSPEAFERYYRENAHVAELMMLTKARFVAGDEKLGRWAETAAHAILYEGPKREGLAEEVLAMRRRLEDSATGRDVKRGFGGIVDVEFIAEYLKLRQGRAFPALRTPATLSALAAARREGFLTSRQHETLLTALQFLRSVESRMRIVYDMVQARIPDAEEDRNHLARRLGYVDTDSVSAGESLIEEYEYHTAKVREVFLAVLEPPGPFRAGDRRPGVEDRGVRPG